MSHSTIFHRERELLAFFYIMHPKKKIICFGIKYLYCHIRYESKVILFIWWVMMKPFHDTFTHVSAENMTIYIIYNYFTLTGEAIFCQMKGSARTFRLTNRPINLHFQVTACKPKVNDTQLLGILNLIFMRLCQLLRMLLPLLTMQSHLINVNLAYPSINLWHG